MEKWKGKIAVVTGGSSGIGAAIAQKLCENEVKTIILDINEPTESFGEFFRCDVSNVDSIKKAFELIEEKFKTIQILINNAGTSRNFALLDPSDDVTEKITKVANVNFLGVVHCARQALLLMQKSNDYGIIINTCSIGGIINKYLPGMIIYGPTKHAVRSFSELLRQELALSDNKKIRVTNLCPGIVETNIYANTGNKEKVQMLAPNMLDAKNIAEGVMSVLSTPYEVNISEITIRSMCEKF